MLALTNIAGAAAISCRGVIAMSYKSPMAGCVLDRRWCTYPATASLLCIETKTNTTVRFQLLTTGCHLKARFVLFQRQKEVML